MKINPKKCSFGVEEGPLLGHLITKQGIRANPSKVKAITDIEQPKMLKDIQSLNGKLADLSQFLSKGAKRSLPFFKVLKSCTNKKNIHQTQEVAAAVQEIKKFVETLPTLTAPIHGEVLMMYLEASTESINAALFSRREKDRDDSNKEMPKDFLIKAPPEDNRKKVERKTDTKLEETKISCEWKLYTDGASSSDGSCVVKGIYAAKQLAIREYLQRTKEALRRRSIKEKEVLQVKTKEEESWMIPIHEYLLSSLLPKDPKESRKIRIKAPWYKLIKSSLYKKSFYTPCLCCIATPKTNDVIKEIHDRSCGFNTKPRSMVVRITKQGYYWPSMQRDVSRIIQDCEKCKEQFVVKKRAKIGAIIARNSLPFSHWGVNIIRPLSTAPGGLKFLAVAIVYSTKWIEAKPLTTDDKHFKEGIFADLCKGLKITQSFSPITEHMEIMSRIEKQLAQSQQGWVDDLSQVLWVHRTLPRNNQEETPFSLTYGSEAIIPTVESIVAKDGRGRTKEVTKRKESKEVASIEKAYYQNELRRYHSKRNSPSNYKVGDFVLLLQNNTENPQVWQGPHMIREVHEGELYKIIDASDHSLIQTAKGTNLHKFYM
ncbi:reverse transcriptase domain-containing protein [Tanacetum coccineum]